MFASSRTIPSSEVTLSGPVDPRHYGPDTVFTSRSRGDSSRSAPKREEDRHIPWNGCDAVQLFLQETGLGLGANTHCELVPLLGTSRRDHTHPCCVWRTHGQDAEIVTHSESFTEGQESDS